VLPVLAAADVSMAASTLRAAADIAVSSVSKATEPGSAKGTLAAAHARAAAVMSLITVRGSLLHTPAARASLAAATHPENDSDHTLDFVDAESGPMKGEITAAQGQKPTGAPAPSAEQKPEAEDRSSAPAQHTGDSVLAVSGEREAERWQSSPEGLADGHHTSAAGAAAAEHESMNSAQPSAVESPEQDQLKDSTPVNITSSGLAVARQHCLMVRFPTVQHPEGYGRDACVQLFVQLE